MTVQLVTDNDRPAALLERMAGRHRYAVDTELHPERTYCTKVALQQFGEQGCVVLVDVRGRALLRLSEPMGGAGKCGCV